MISKLWENKSIKDTYDKRYELKLHVPTNSDYYFQHVTRFSTPDFVPTFDDMMMAKLKTTGVQEVTFQCQVIIFHSLFRL
jgi:guanine nucleotide-binding protein subunit alpha